MLQEGLYAYLAAQAGITTLTSTRIYPLVIPERVYTEATRNPCLVYSVDAKARQVRYAGTDTLVDATVTVDCYATSYASAQALAAAVRAALVDYTGTWTGNGSPQSATSVKHVFIETERDMMDPEPGLYRVSQIYTVWYDEA